MADIGSAVRAVLAADGAVAALVSTRIYPDKLPQNVTYPAISYSVDDENSFEHHGALTGKAEAYVEVACWATTRTVATSMAEAARLALSRYAGTSAGVVVSHIHPGRGFVNHEEPDDGSDHATYWHEREFHTFYVEATS